MHRMPRLQLKLKKQRKTLQFKMIHQMRRLMSLKLPPSKLTTSTSRKTKMLEAESTETTRRKALATKMIKHNRTKHPRNK